MSAGGRIADDVAAGSSRRGFLARVGAAVLATTSARAVGSMIAPEEAESKYYTFCGHTFTTDSCPHPTGLPRIDRHGLPVRAKDGHAVDDLGRLIDHHGRPIDESGRPLTDPDGNPLPRASRTRVCHAAAEKYGFHDHRDGTWHRCCGGHVRKLVDCCGYVQDRINGDAALTGYCFNGRKVFCVMYYETHVPC
jgi:hypothetical protein